MKKITIEELENAIHEIKELGATEAEVTIGSWSDLGGHYVNLSIWGPEDEEIKN